MNKMQWMLTLIILLTLTVAGCWGSESDEEVYDADPETSETSDTNDGETSDSDMESVPEGFAGVAQAMKEAQKALSGAQEGEEIEVIDFRELRERLPSEMVGMERVDASGERTGALGFKFSQAQGKYRDDDGQMDVTIIDMGNISGAAMLGYAWLSAEFDRESDSGYERTMKFKGYPAFQKFEHDGKRFEMQVVLGQRIIVQVDGRGKDMDEVEDDMEDLIDEVEELVPGS